MLIIGVGNEFRCDDAIGLIIARKIKEKNPQLRIIESSGEGTELLTLWQEEPSILVIDAIRSQQNPGYVHCVDIHKEDLPQDFAPCSTHAFGLREAIELAKTLEQLPGHFIIYGIEGENFSYGTELSPQVQNAVPQIVEEIQAILCNQMNIPHT